MAQALTCSKGKNGELVAAHEQLKQAFSAKKEKLVEANTALATSYQDAEGLRRKLTDVETKIAAYSELFDKAKNIGEKAPRKKTVKQEPEEFSDTDDLADDIPPHDEEEMEKAERAVGQKVTSERH